MINFSLCEIVISQNFFQYFTRQSPEILTSIFFFTQRRSVRRDLFLFYLLKLRRGASYDARAQRLRVLAPLGAALCENISHFLHVNLRDFFTPWISWIIVLQPSNHKWWMLTHLNSGVQVSAVLIYNATKPQRGVTRVASHFNGWYGVSYL